MNIWQFIHTHLEQHTPVVLLYVVESKDSSPGRQGFKMAVLESGEMQGSIGGGIMEHKWVEQAKNLLRKKEYSPFIKQQIHNKQSTQNQSGMICSGEQTLAIYPLTPKDLPQIKQVLHSLNNSEQGSLILNENGVQFQVKNINTKPFQYQYSSEKKWEYKELIGYKKQAYIIGGGHVGLACSQVLSLLDFHITIIDDRPNLNTFEQNNFAHQKIITPYQDIAKYIPEGDQIYVIIMTFGYRSDDTVIRCLLGKQFKYLGMMGSKAKIKKLLAELQKDEFSKQDIGQIHTPIGLPIHSKTPHEIGISIAAQIIQLDNA